MEIKFEIGNWVKVTHIAKPEYNNNGQRFIKSISITSSPIIGQFVGARYKNTGEYIPGDYPHYKTFDNDDYDPALFICGKRVLVYLISIGLLNKPIEAFPKHVHKTLTGDKKLPNFKYFKHPWSKENKEFMRNEMKDWPRDFKGKWIKKTL